MHTQHCSHWCPGAKAPGHQYPQCWLNIHWSRVMHIYASNLTNIGSDNGLSPGRRQAIIWSRDRSNCWDIVNRTPRNKLQWNLNPNPNIFIEENTFDNVVCEIPAILCRPQCVNKLTLRQNGHYFADNAFKHILWMKTLKSLLKFHWILFQMVQ